MEDKEAIAKAIYHALDAAGDRCEQYGGDIGELKRVRDTGPDTFDKVRRLNALYPRPLAWWQRILFFWSRT